jgi:hypothetical protein
VSSDRRCATCARWAFYRDEEHRGRCTHKRHAHGKDSFWAFTPKWDDGYRITEEDDTCKHWKSLAHCDGPAVVQQLAPEQAEKAGCAYCYQGGTHLVFHEDHPEWGESVCDDHVGEAVHSMRIYESRMR